MSLGNHLKSLLGFKTLFKYMYYLILDLIQFTTILIIIHTNNIYLLNLHIDRMRKHSWENYYPVKTIIN